MSTILQVRLVLYTQGVMQVGEHAALNTPKDFEIRWHNRLQFRVLAIFFGMFFLAMLTIIVIAKTLGEDLIERQAYLKLADGRIPCSL